MNFRKLVKALVPKNLFRKIEPFGHLCEAVLFNVIYGFPARKLKIIGVTGTNGKTTTAFLIHKMLHEVGYEVGLMTTAAYGAGDNLKPQDIHMTNVPVPALLKRIKAMKEEGIDWLVMEVTSHALVQHRTWGLHYFMAVMTNVTPEHLDYHGTFENYRNAKLKLFKQTNRTFLKPLRAIGMRVGIINADDPSANLFHSVIGYPLTYGFRRGDLKARNIKLSSSGSTFDIHISEKSLGNHIFEDSPELYDKKSLDMHMKINLPGKFNIYNALAAAGVGLSLGLTPEQIEQGIAKLDGVLGRMTNVEAGQSFSVLVDFAHTPDALENVLTTAKDTTKGKVILVFGATGDRDKSKRPVMGQVAAKYADLIFLTDDETYTEDPAQIINQVSKGIEQAGGNSKTTIVNDRLEAIKQAFKAAKAGDTVLLTGMGHETTRNMGGKEVAWNEIEIAKQLLKK